MLTVLITDIVGSTRLAAELGDERWRALLDAHDAAVRLELARYRGREIRSVGDGFVAVFKSPTDAVECAQAIVAAARRAGVGVRAGIHCGEVELRGKDVSGIGVHIAARIAVLAGEGEVLVSETLQDLVTGSKLTFAPRGSHALRGVPGDRRLFAVADAAAITPARRKGTGKGGQKQTAPPAVPEPLRVLLADDHPLWRQTLRGLLEHMGAAVVAEAEDGDAAVALTRFERPDVVVMDIDMPGMDGIAATRAIVTEDPGARVLILSAVREREQVVAAVRAGAYGYIVKTAGAAEINDAIRRVHAGEVAFPPELAPVVLAELRGVRRRDESARANPLGQLTPREREVLSLMAEGCSNQAIAEQLYVGAKTVEGYIAAIFNKLALEPTPGDHRRVKAVLVYLQHAMAWDRGTGQTPGKPGGKKPG